MSSLFHKVFSVEKLKTKILNKYPVPDAGDLFAVKSLDSFISLLLEKRNKQFDKRADKGAQNIRSRVMKVMGLLSELLSNLEGSHGA